MLKRFDAGELGVLDDEHAVCDLGVHPRVFNTCALEPAKRDAVLAQDRGALNDAPTSRIDGEFNVPGAGFGFIHAFAFTSRTLPVAFRA